MPSLLVGKSRSHHICSVCSVQGLVFSSVTQALASFLVESVMGRCFYLIYLPRLYVPVSRATSMQHPGAQRPQLSGTASCTEHKTALLPPRFTDATWRSCCPPSCIVSSKRFLKVNAPSFVMVHQDWSFGLDQTAQVNAQTALHITGHRAM